MMPVDPIFYWAMVVVVWSCALVLAGMTVALFVACVRDLFFYREAQ